MESQLNWMKYCQDNIIKRMKSDRFGSLFSNPVLEASDSIIPAYVKENYRLVIKNPMDYKSVKAKLENGIYSKPEEFFDDMKLIYDNCMRFNPPVGASKWAHDAAVSNLKKFTKMWEAASKTIYKLYEKDCKSFSESGTFEETSQAPSSVPNDFQVPILSSTNYLNESDLNSARMNETSEGPLSPNDGLNLFSDPLVNSQLDLQCNFNNNITPRNKWSFRLNLQSIQEYKVRNGFLNQAPEINSFSSYLEPRPVVSPEIQIDNTASPVNFDPYQSDVMSTVHTSADVQNFGAYNDSALNTVDGAMDYGTMEQDSAPAFPIEVPEMLSKNDDGVVCVSFFSQSECNRLFPKCNIIGMTAEKPNYNISDVSIRYIYNQLYMNDINLKFDQKKEVTHDPQMLDDEYRLKENRSKVKINFSNIRDSNYNYYSPNVLNYYRNSDINLPQGMGTTQRAAERKKLDVNVFYRSDDADENGSQADKPTGGFKKLVSKFVGKGTVPDPNLGNNQCVGSDGKNGTSDHDSAYSNGLSNGNGSYSAVPPELVSASGFYSLTDPSENVLPVRDEVLDLFIEIESNSILNVSGAEGLLERNLFSRVAVKGEFFKICEKPNLSLLCGNDGYFKLDESGFVFEDADMKHIRIFFFNCSKSKVRVSCKRSTFTELVLQNRYNFSLVSNLHNEFKLGNVSNLPFFTLPNSTPICFSKQQDILYRFQQIHNSLPVKLLALHIISPQ
ncbi:hypothetical protein MACJ_001137 [Theileria orientalis]|uniref:Bromo domain-containing protein n=1 Tax=Theileria orientalis TaxID=68886 RepID=A0A976M7W0_THEOR|nr:hypothetical protein MACJ_001137 [Theileria orientalis]